ncbi:MAG: 50S ribosomal protein L18Ae [Candidatus Bathyarchaeia archaeon]
MNQTRKFALEGYMKKKSDRLLFKQIVEAPNEKLAIELLYCLIGSRHRVKRSEIKIQKIEEIKAP